jgi:hypothetical protein
LKGFRQTHFSSAQGVMHFSSGMGWDGMGKKM